MAITSLATYLAASKQSISFNKPSLTAVAATPFSIFAQAGDPGAGTLAGTSVAAGVVPTSSTAGCPVLNAFGSGATGYLSKAEFASNVACRIALYDLLWKGGAYPFGASQALTGQPSFSGRLPSTSPYEGIELWMEQVTLGTTAGQSVDVTYNDAASSSQSTGTISSGAAASIVGRMTRLPLITGSIQTVTNVVGSASGSGTFNILVLRKLWAGRIPFNNTYDVHSMMKTGLPVVFPATAFFMIITPDATASGVPDCRFEIANG